MTLPPDPRRFERGMTLVEVLMVVFIIGLSAGLVVITLPEGDSPQLKEAKTFAQTIRTAQDTAILSGAPTGVALSENSYAILAWRAQQWTPIRGGKTLPSAVDLSLNETQPEAPDGWPILVFDPTGVNSAISFRFAGRGDPIDVLLNEGGEVQLETR